MTRTRPAFADDNPDGIKIGDLVMDHEMGLSGIVMAREENMVWRILFSDEEGAFKGWSYSNALELLNAAR